MRCILTGDGPATLELFDVRGRLLWRERIPEGSGPMVDRALPAALTYAVWRRNPGVL